jgi:hypothetical protein
MKMRKICVWYVIHERDKGEEALAIIHFAKRKAVVLVM